MAKNNGYIVHVQSSEFKQLIEAQQSTLKTLKSMHEILTWQRRFDALQAIEEIKLERENREELKILKKELGLEQDHLKVAKDTNKHIKALASSSGKAGLDHDEALAISNLSKSIKSLKTFGDRFKDFGKSLKENLSPSSLKIKALEKMNILGLFSKSIDRERFIKQQRAAGSTKNRADLKGDFENAYKISAEIQRINKELLEGKTQTGLSESQYAKTVKGKNLTEQRKLLAEEQLKYDIRAQYAVKGDKTSSQKHQDEGREEEAAIESAEKTDKQIDILTKIEKNTKGESPEQKAKPAEDSKGGLISGLLGGGGGGGAGKVIKSMKDFGIGMIVMAGALWVASKALQSFADVQWEDVGKGLLTLGALVASAIALDKVKGQIIGGVAALGLLELALWGMSKVMKEFHEVEWEDMAKAGVAIVAFSAAMFGLGSLLMSGVGALIFGAGVLGITAMGVAVGVLGVGLKAVGSGMDRFVDGLKKLGDIDGSNLLKVAAGLVALAPAMALFSAGNAVAGMGNLVTGFLSAISGQKSPVEQLVDIGKAGDGISKAGSGMQQLGSAMKAFSGIKSEDLKAINDFPWEKATMFVAAGGAMSVNGAQVYNQSKANVDQQAQAGSGTNSGNTTIVNAPVNNVQKNSNFIKPNIRNQESSQARYLQTRYAI